MMNALTLFHPFIARWFAQAVGEPTEVQSMAWPRIAAGEHVLITAPTGSGKTLAAFLWALNELITGKRPTGHTSVLYVSPLKALNNDIRRNLLSPLAELEGVFREAGEPFPEIRVLTRSGDTPQSERVRMQRHPPEILITTPESLNLLLSSPGGRSMLRGLATVILDEVHAVIDTRRGTHLITAVERLVPLSGEFQRIALSATIKPLETVAEFIGGFASIPELPLSQRGTEGDFGTKLVRRPVSIVRAEWTKQFDVRVRFPPEARDRDTSESIWDSLAEEFKRIIGAHRSTLLFTTGRRLCEKITAKINASEDRPIAYAHHGSLSREIREEVEHKLKAGELKSIVATSSLELGIDIGALDEVVLIQSPPSVASAIQRIGRAGHRVSEVSRGMIVPTHAFDFVEAAVLARAVLAQDIESARPIECPLDVLAQVIVSMAGVEMWDIDSLYAHLRSSYPYRNLRREEFDLVLNMLGGRYAESRIRELRPRVSIDRLDNTVSATKGALLAVYTSGGMIPDWGYFHLRHADTGALIGELDEEFVWEDARVGYVFTLGTQNWRIERVTHNDVFVSPGSPKVLAPPFWKAEDEGRDFHFSGRIGEFLEEANENLDSPEWAERLKSEYRMDETAAEELIGFLQRQREETGADLPHRHHILLEFVRTGPGGVPGNQLVIHTGWGGRVNQPYAMALDAAWEERFGQRPEIYSGNDSIVIQLPHEASGAEVLSLVTSTNVESLLRRRLEGSGFFGARFRECAGRALLLTRDRVNERMPLWMSRLRSQKLMESVMGYEDFPILLEAWCTCLRDEFDMESLRRVLAELEAGAVGWSEARTSYPSPMARTIAWNQVNQYMYMTDEPVSGKTSKLRSDLLSDVVFTPGLRPAVSREVVERFERKRRRLAEGYAPETPRELLDWVKERLVIPLSEWRELLVAIRRDHGIDTDDWLGEIGKKIVRIEPPGASEPVIIARESADRIAFGLWPTISEIPLFPPLTKGDERGISLPGGYDSEEDRDEVLTSVLGEWLRFYGPVRADRLAGMLGVEQGRLNLALEDLVDDGEIITGELVTGEESPQFCDAENFGALLRIMRAEAVPAFEPLSAEWLPLFLAAWQGIARAATDIERLAQRIERLLCYPAPAALWETEILPARAQGYAASWLDGLMQEGGLRWVGSEGERVAFAFEADLDLLGGDFGEGESGDSDLFPDPAGRYDFMALLRSSNLSGDDLAARLWGEVWRGRVTNDTFAALRKGIENRFKVPGAALGAPKARGRGGRLGGRSGFARWKGSLPFAGAWFRLPPPAPPADLIETEERNKDRVRLLRDRYGILFRELLQNESEPFRWAALFRSLRLMELSGEVLAGYFFEGIPGPQFISHAAFRVLQRKLPDEAVYWLAATDPASLSGVGIEPLKANLPKRIGGTHLVYRGKDLVMVSQRNGKSLTFHAPPDDPRLTEYLGVLRHLLMRAFQPVRRVTIETINGEDASRSPYIDGLRTAFEVIIEHRHVVLYRKGG